MVYSLFGIFDVNMPLLYGEGGVRAFVRLQEETVRSIEDYTIFLWADDGLDASIGMSAQSATAVKLFTIDPDPNRWDRGFIDLSQLQRCDPGTIEDNERPMMYEFSDLLRTAEPPVTTSRGLRMSVYAYEINNVLFTFLQCYIWTRTGSNEAYDYMPIFRC